MRFWLTTILTLLLALNIIAAPKQYIDRNGQDMRGFDNPNYQLTLALDYAYNRTWGHTANLNLQARMPFNPYFELQTNIQLATANVYTGAVILRPKFDLPVGELFAETTILYKAIARARQHDFNTALSLGYRMDYVSLQLGFFTRTMTHWDRRYQSADQYNNEPFNLLYRLELFCRPQYSTWNLSASLANIDDYQMERMWQPIFGLSARYNIDTHWRVLLQAQCKPTGMFHLNATLYSAYLRAGFTYQF